MIIEIGGIGWPNKGAELMLVAVVQQLRKRYGKKVQICCRPAGRTGSSYSVLGGLDVWQSARVNIGRYPLAGVFNCVDQRLLKTFGIVRERDIAGYLDASGFRYSDQWGLASIQRNAGEIKRIKRRGGPVIILPQAVGPFRNPEVSAVSREIFGIADAVFLRDQTSFEYYNELMGPSNAGRQCGDFTNSVEGEQTIDSVRASGSVIFIPNRRMIDKTSGVEGRNYFQQMVRLARHVESKGKRVVLLNHEGASDLQLCYEMATAIREDCEVLSPQTAAQVKGVIRNAFAVVSSRFHGVMSALSQGVPTACTSWSHKYQELMGGYGQASMVLGLDDHGDSDAIIKTSLLDEDENRRIRTQLELAAEEKLRETDSMWDSVFQVLDPFLKMGCHDRRDV